MKAAILLTTIYSLLPIAVTAQIYNCDGTYQNTPCENGHVVMDEKPYDPARALAAEQSRALAKAKSDEYSREYSRRQSDSMRLLMELNADARDERKTQAMERLSAIEMERLNRSRLGP